VPEEAVKDRLAIETTYLNYDFARYIGGRAIYEGALSLDGLNSGIGEWFFRQVAFPEAHDNTEACITRYFNRDDAGSMATWRVIIEKRPGLEAFLESLIDLYRLDGADVVEFTSFCSQSAANFATARLLKRRRPDLVTVVGGPNREAEMGREIARHVPQIDYVFSGPDLSRRHSSLPHLRRDHGSDLPAIAYRTQPT
jgi:hypothetical protein